MCREEQRLRSYEILDEALESITDAGPDLRNGLTNHAPMAIEALCALGRPDAVRPWLDRYRQEMLPWPARRERIEGEAWRAALGQAERTSDWRACFHDQLQDAPWQRVLDRWTRRLAPGICASAMHGVIRVGHAARALANQETPVRIAELADALASWAATYQVLPTHPAARPAALRPAQAIRQVPVVPPDRRRFTGTITSSLAALDEFPAFAPVIALADLEGDPAAVLSELTETFARVYLANARDVLGAIVFVHGVTSVAALRSMLPHLDPETARRATRYTWQAGCALYAAFGERPAPAAAEEGAGESSETLTDRAIANGDEHAIKFTEACLREHALRPSAVYPSAARHAIEVLKP